MSDLTIVLIWVIKIIFVEFFCVFLTTSQHLLVLLGPYHFYPLLCPSLHEMFPGSSDFLAEISSLSHFVVFFYLFVLVTEEGFPISPCYSLELCIQIFPFLICLSLLCSNIVRPPQTTILPFAFLFLGGSLDHCLL